MLTKFKVFAKVFFMVAVSTGVGEYAIASERMGDACVLGEVGRLSINLDKHVIDIQAVVINDEVDLPGAPLTAIGKVIYGSDVTQRPICTATLTSSMGNLIISTKTCLSGASSAPMYFVANSSSSNPSPFGTRRIINVVGDPNYDVAYGLLESSVSIPSLPWRTGVFAQSWMHGNYWYVAGYEATGKPTAHLESGCRVNEKRGSYVSFDCGEPDDFLEGAPLFSYLCGGWRLVGIKTREFNGWMATSEGFWQSLHRAYGLWSVGTICDASVCTQPTMNKPNLHFLR